jgi:hypothetical protein
MDNLIHNIHKTYVNAVSKLTPTLSESEFLKRGVLTPEEVSQFYISFDRKFYEVFFGSVASHLYVFSLLLQAISSCSNVQLGLGNDILKISLYIKCHLK